jgi:signal transduction histidine kinase
VSGEYRARPGGPGFEIVRGRLERGRWPAFAIEEADLTDLGGRLVSFMEPSARQAGVRMELSGVKRARCRCDPALVEQILLNLMKNSIEAMPSGGTLRLSTGAIGGMTWLEVSDDGPGLPAARARLFQLATTKGTEGTNSGQSQRLAQGMGGNPSCATAARHGLAPHPAHGGERHRIMSQPRHDAGGR